MSIAITENNQGIIAAMLGLKNASSSTSVKNEYARVVAEMGFPENVGFYRVACEYRGTPTGDLLIGYLNTDLAYRSSVLRSPYYDESVKAELRLLFSWLPWNRHFV
jgi:hypothetical protein